MRRNTNTPRRKNMRLNGYDYSQAGAYFVTICTHSRECVLGEVVNGKMHLYEAGDIVLDCWNDLANHYAAVELDEFVVMPNHVHGIIVIVDTGKMEGSSPQGAGYKPATTSVGTLPEVVRGFKTFSARRINQTRNRTGQPVWQRNYYERVIRDEKTLAAVREYIVNNPAKWAGDSDNPRNFSAHLR